MSITIKTKYIVYNHNGTGVRHHHYTEQNTVHDFPDQTANPNEPGNRIASAPAQYAFGNGPDLQFAFMSVNGTKDGDMLYTSPGDYSYHVGTTNINILVVYAPASGIGGPNGGPGIWVDAFNVDTGALSDDLHFISILTPPANTVVDVAQTNEANQNGDVSSLAPEHIRASATIDGGVPFLEWKQIMPTQGIVTSKDFDLAKGDTGKIWIAFYQTPPKPQIQRIDDYYAIWHWVDYATMVDGHGGPGDPGPNLSPEVRDFSVGVALAKTAGQLNKQLRSDLLAIASKQIQVATEALQRKIAENKK
ncbi:MAG: hypothetical protein QM731_10720 [Chitinophagaceae bacterium]